VQALKCKKGGSLIKIKVFAAFGEIFETEKRKTSP
jgi:hypothetical protein